MASYGQEMPPRGGYQPFEYSKKQVPRWIKGKWLIAGWAATTVGLHLIHQHFFIKNIREPELLNSEANIALEPFMLAERNRLLLKRCVDNRNWEKELMKDVPGWIPGTYYGTPIYHQKAVWADPSPEEFWAHSEFWEGYFNQQTEKHNH